MTVEYKKYARKPFQIEAAEITVENIAEIAPLVGALKEDAEGKPYIKVDPSKVPHVHKVFPGYYITRMGDNLRCFMPNLFAEQFVAVGDTWSISNSAES